MRFLFIQYTIDSESIGVAYISSVLKRAGHKTELFIASLESDLTSRIKEFLPDVILFSIIITKQDYYNLLGKRLKRLFPDIKIIAGGPYLTLKNSFAENDWLDFAIVGEGEEATVELAYALENKLDIREIKNLIYKKGNRLFVNELRDLNQDLDILPLPDRELYLKYKSFKNLTVKRFISGRGCPYSCTFCFTRKLRDLYSGKGRYIRKHSVLRVCEEINQMKSKAVLKTVHFSDDIFLTDKKWLEEFYNVYPSRVGIPFQCNLTADIINEDTIKLLSECGLRGVGIGLESGVERIRNKMLNKRFTNEEILEVANILHKYKVEIYTYNMIALPNESIDDAIETLDLNIKMGVKITQCNIAIPFEGLPLTDIAVEQSLLSDYSSASNIVKRPESPLIKTESPDQFERLFLLFPFLVKLRSGARLAERLIRLPLNSIYRVFHKISYFLNMKRYYDISFFSGFRIFLDIKRGEHYLKKFFEQ